MQAGLESRTNCGESSASAAGDRMPAPSQAQVLAQLLALEL